MGKKEEGSTRFIKSPLVPLILWIIFIATFYWLYFTLTKELSPDIVSLKVTDFAKKYGVFIPALYGILTIIIHYLLCFIRWVIRLKCFVSSLILVFIVYWFNLFMWIQLMFYEPRYTDVAKYIIDAFSKPILWASALTLLLSLVFVFIKTKNS
jgi:hypothetical protein